MDKIDYDENSFGEFLKSKTSFKKIKNITEKNIFDVINEYYDEKLSYEKL